METSGGTYIRFGRGAEAVAVLVDAETVSLITETLKAITIKGTMATGGGTTGRTPAGTAQSNKIFEIVKLLEAKKD